MVEKKDWKIGVEELWRKRVEQWGLKNGEEKGEDGFKESVWQKSQEDYSCMDGWGNSNLSCLVVNLIVQFKRLENNKDMPK